MKKTQMLRPNNTPARPARRKSTRLGQRLVSATITRRTPDAIHRRQNDSTTPDACVDLPSTPPNAHSNGAKSIASTPPRPASLRVTVRPADRVDRVMTFAEAARPEVGDTEVEDVATWAR